ncbi:MAG: TetR/AcrR family transcriptional regulator [Desulfobacteraceae bacterium]|nr:TetR/AcrR family transcriptional regulator [Desulfobacteraceae bacterium]
MKQGSTIEEKKIRILGAASRVFARKGFAGTRIAEVAVEAGIGKGTVYEYFDSKEVLFFDVFQWFFERNNSSLKVGINALRGTAADRLMVMNDSIITAWMDEMDSFALVMEFWSASSSSTLRKRFKLAFKAAYDAIRELVAALIREGIDTGEFRADSNPDSIAASLVGTWDALLLQKWFGSVEDPLAYSRDFLAVIIRGLSKTGEITQ